jgi:hypothetical protein
LSNARYRQPNQITVVTGVIGVWGHDAPHLTPNTLGCRLQASEKKPKRRQVNGWTP